MKSEIFLMHFRFFKRHRKPQVILILSLVTFITIRCAWQEFPLRLVSLSVFQSSIDNRFMLSQQSDVTEGCVLCSFNVTKGKHKTNSSKKDVILTVAYRKITNLMPFVRSLRTTGCSAQVVILCSSDIIKAKRKDYLDYIEKCGVQFVDVGNVDIRLKSNFMYYRNFLFEQFVSVNINQIDRILLVDLYDTIFQRDPFTDAFSKDNIYFSNEGFKLESDERLSSIIQYNIIFFSYLNPKVARNKLLMKEIFDRNMLSDGTIAGGAQQVYTFLHYMERIGCRNNFSTYGDFQAMLNIFVRTCVFQDILNVTVIGPRSEFMTSISAYYRKYRNLQIFKGVKLGNISRGSKVPAILHQYHVCDDLTHAVLISCPPTKFYYDYIKDTDEVSSFDSEQ